MDGMILNALTLVDSVCKDFVFRGYEAIVHTYTSAILGLATLTLAVFGYMSSLGYIKTPIPELITRSMKVGFILSFALINQYFANYIYNLVTIAPNEMAGTLIHAIPNANIGDVHTAGEALQKAFYETIRLGNAVAEEGSFHNMSPFLWGWFIKLIGIFLAVVALLELIVAKFGLAILLALTPLALAMLFFESTKSALFDGWLRHVIGFALTPLFVLCTIALILLMMSQSLVDMTHAVDADRLELKSFMPYILYGMIGIGMLYRASALASTIAGSISVSLSHHPHNATKKGFAMAGKSVKAGAKWAFNRQGNASTKSESSLGGAISKNAFSATNETNRAERHLAD
ncbi:MAG: hypothetical protein LEGION0398_MBIBDBAK_00229 [Legionellaceae bacterium]